MDLARKAKFRALCAATEEECRYHRTSRTLAEKSKLHQAELRRLRQEVRDEPLSSDILLLKQTKQIVGMCTIIQNPMTDAVDFNFYFDRLSSLLVERAMETLPYPAITVTTPQGHNYRGLSLATSISAVVVLRGGACLETGLRRVIPDCATGRILIQTNYRTGEPELYFSRLSPSIEDHEGVLVLDTQMSSGGAALMAVKVLVDHGVKPEQIIFICCFAGIVGMNRLLKVFPGARVVVGMVVEDWMERWIEKKYFGC
ncbi:MAG: hypothetical protein Q9191_000355 [Dirinaria sp. TL-2023a]